MAFAVPLVKKDYQLYALPGARGRGAGTRSRNNLGSGTSLGSQNIGRKRSVSDPSLSMAKTAGSLASTRFSTSTISKRRSSVGTSSALARLLHRRGSVEKDKKAKEAKEAEEESSSEPPLLERSNSGEESGRYCGGRRGSGGNILPPAQSGRRSPGSGDTVHSILCAITEDEEDDEEDIEVPIKMLSDSEETLYEDEGSDAEDIVNASTRKLSLAARKSSIVTPADTSSPILIRKSEVAAVVSMSPESKRRWRNSFLTTIRTRLGQIERVLSTATPAN